MQHGSIIQATRKQGPDVWQFRWSEKDRSGRRIYRKGRLEQSGNTPTRKQLAMLRKRTLVLLAASTSFGQRICGFLHPRMSGETFCKLQKLFGVPDGI